MFRWNLFGAAAAILAAVAGFEAAQRWAGAQPATAVLEPTPAPDRAIGKVIGPGVQAQPIGRKLPAPGAGQTLASNLNRMWEASATVVPTTPQAAGAGLLEGWRFGGSYQTEQGSVVIVVFDRGTPPIYLRRGDTLPNGATVVAIQPDSVTVRTQINKRWVLVILDI